ncbi:hypothetical protein [Microbulbifer hydrolyticus]|uniref:DUF3108 domain-containing protein n=1 Tax=Microbulbifer hydrolyticus TaxID=48074 RepID=A0A6P1TFA1_9GAMM|nr:hypothetical protein [Microbulbifer hydrolyticus]MBB5210023.1 hypothetical protein [Microbulbifer hydrolyticus]QHQ39452.1 hypothetical protein GTQ55_10980 [Microbulbifer hydrolyticus]
MKTIRLVLQRLFLACTLGLYGCVNETTYSNRSMVEPDQTVKQVYGQPTVFSEGDSLVALAVDQSTYRSRDNVIFLRLWVYNGTTSSFSIGHTNVSARAELQAELTLQASAGQSLHSLSQRDFNHWRKEHTRRKILSVNEYYKGSIVNHPYLALNGIEECTPYDSRDCIDELLIKHNDASIQVPIALGFGKIARNASGQLVLIDDNPFSRVVREINYRRTTPKHRHIFPTQELPPGEIQGGFIALDIASLPADGKRNIVVEIQAGSETHQFVIEQSPQVDPAT